MPLLSSRNPSDSLAKVSQLIDSIRRVAGAPGLSIGVIHNNSIIYERYCGFRDVEKRLEVNRDTIFYVASLTKAITATALGILVSEGHLSWTKPVHEILPEMSRFTEVYSAKLTVLDILSHRTGKAWADALYLQSNNRILLAKEQAIPLFDYLAQIEPVRSTYMYNNHTYNIAGLVVEKISGLKWSTFVEQRIFNSLGMTRSFNSHPSDSNVAVPYNILANGEPCRLPFCNVSNDTLMFAGQSVRTSMSDLLRYSKAYLQALSEITPACKPNNISHKVNKIKQEIRPVSWLSSCFRPIPVHENNLGTNLNRPTSISNPIREISTLIRPHVARPTESVLEQTYGLGWNRTELPGYLDFGWNKHILGSLPDLGQRYPGKLVIWHGEICQELPPQFAYCQKPEHPLLYSRIRLV